MQPYDKLIMQQLKGETPKEKYDYLLKIQDLLHRTAFPQRGSKEEQWGIMEVVNEINENELVEWPGNYKNN